MSLPTNAKYFTFTGKNKYEKMNFRNYIFDSLDLKGKKNQFFSFYRSDFRASRIYQSKFKYVTFDMVDFIDVFVKSSFFTDCNFGNSEIKNVYFNDVEFKNNNYNSSIQQSIFKNCNFINENFCASAYDVTYENCNFQNCDFEGSTFENIKFINCNLYKCELSTMHAENFSFEYCKLEEVVWGVDYWFTYLIADSTIKNIALKYRGEIVDIYQNKEIIISILNDLIEQHSYYEYLNILILQQIIFDNSKVISIAKHINLYKKIFSELFNEIDIIHRRTQLLNIFKLIRFYFFRENFDLYSTLKIIEYINSLNFDVFQLDEAITYKAEIYKINEIFSDLPFSYTQISQLPTEDELCAIIRLDYDDKVEAESFIDNTFEILKKILHLKNNKEYYKILSKKKGSWTFEILASALLILTLYKIIKDATNLILKRRIQIKLSSLTLDGLQGKKYTKKEIDYIEKSINLLQITGLFNEELLNKENIFNEDQLSKILDLGIKFIDKTQK